MTLKMRTPTAPAPGPGTRTPTWPATMMPWPVNGELSDIATWRAYNDSQQRKNKTGTGVTYTPDSKYNYNNSNKGTPTYVGSEYGGKEKEREGGLRSSTWPHQERNLKSTTYTQRDSPLSKPRTLPARPSPPPPPSAPQQPAVAATAAFAFAFETRRRRPLDWRVIAGADPDAVARTTDIAGLEAALETVAFGDIEGELGGDVDANGNTATFVRVIKLAQLMLEYLLYVQNALSANNEQLRGALAAWQQYARALRTDAKRALDAADNAAQEVAGRYGAGEVAEAVEAAVEEARARLEAAHAQQMDAVADFSHARDAEYKAKIEGLEDELAAAKAAAAAAAEHKSNQLVAESASLPNPQVAALNVQLAALTSDVAHLRAQNEQLLRLLEERTEQEREGNGGREMTHPQRGALWQGGAPHVSTHAREEEEEKDGYGKRRYGVPIEAAKSKGKAPANITPPSSSDDSVSSSTSTPSSPSTAPLHDDVADEPFHITRARVAAVLEEKVREEMATYGVAKNAKGLSDAQHDSLMVELSRRRSRADAKARSNMSRTRIRHSYDEGEEDDGDEFGDPAEERAAVEDHLNKAAAKVFHIESDED